MTGAGTSGTRSSGRRLRTVTLLLALTGAVVGVVGLLLAARGNASDGAAGAVALFALWAASPFAGLAGLALLPRRTATRVPPLVVGALALVLSGLAGLAWLLDDSSTAPLLAVWVPLYQWGLVVAGALGALVVRLLAGRRATGGTPPVG